MFYSILNIDFKVILDSKIFLIGLSEIDRLPYTAQQEFAELSHDLNLKPNFQKKRPSLNSGSELEINFPQLLIGHSMFFNYSTLHLFHLSVYFRLGVAIADICIFTT